MNYAIERGRLLVLARSSVHDTQAVWSRISGTAAADLDALATGRLDFSLELAVDMTAFDAGDFLKNRKLRKDLDLERYPSATYRLGGLARVVDLGGGAFQALTSGVLAWRGRELAIEAAGEGRVDAGGFSATARFALDVTRLGVTPPRLLMFKVDDEVEVKVELGGHALA